MHMPMCSATPYQAIRRPVEFSGSRHN